MKNVTGKKKMLKSLIGFLSANRINNYNRKGKKEEKKEKKIQKSLQNKPKNKKNNCFSWVSAVRVLSCAGITVHLISLDALNTVLISGPAVGAAQILLALRNPIKLLSIFFFSCHIFHCCLKPLPLHWAFAVLWSFPLSFLLFSFFNFNFSNLLLFFLLLFLFKKILIYLF